MELKTVLSLALVVLLTAVSTWALLPQKERVVYSTEHQQRQIDSLTTSLQASYTTRDALLDSLGNVTEGFLEELSEKNQTILSLTNVSASLRIQRDALEDSLNALPAPSGINLSYFNEWVFPDTSLTISETFNNRLFRVTVDYGIRSNEVFATLHDPEMLRLIEFDIATIQRDWTVTQIITSPDLTDVNMRSVTELERPREIPWFWIGTGTGATVVLLIGAIL